MRKKKGQSVLEYVIVLTAVVAAIAWAATKFIQPNVQEGFDHAQTSMRNATGQLPQ